MAYNITIVGLGLMGASLAGALQGFKNATLTGVDKDPDTLEKAKAKRWVHHTTTEITEGVAGADLVIFCVYAKQLPRLLAHCQNALKPGCLLCDICGVKTGLYEAMLRLVPQGVGQIGLHPMAGKERDGIDNADPQLFWNTGMLICPTPLTPPGATALMEALAGHIGCRRTEVVTTQKHDEIIAYTSDLMHLSAAGLCLSPPAEMSLTYTAGAFRDSTRVADINAPAWAGLLLENRANVLQALGQYINDLRRLQLALWDDDFELLCALLQQAGDNKREMQTR